jgi:hypothetical protein
VFVHLIAGLFLNSIDVLSNAFITFDHARLATPGAQQEVLVTLYNSENRMAAIWLMDFLDQSQVIQHLQGAVHAGNPRRRIQFQG